MFFEGYMGAPPTSTVLSCANEVFTDPSGAVIGIDGLPNLTMTVTNARDVTGFRGQSTVSGAFAHTGVQYGVSGSTIAGSGAGPRPRLGLAQVGGVERGLVAPH